MGRQRTINDSEFWRSPKIADRTQEDKATLLYLLTSPYSNIIGVYQIVPRIAAAEMGWTAEQFVSILKRLSNFELVSYEETSGYLWVRIWWDHNSAKMAVATTLRQRTYSQIDAIPTIWRADFLKEFIARIPIGEGHAGEAKASMRDLVAAEMARRGYGVSIPYPYPIDSPAGNDTNNENNTKNTNPTTTLNPASSDNDQTLEFPKLEAGAHEELAKIITRLPQELRQDVLDEISAKLRAGTLRSPIRLAQHFADNPTAFVISDGLNVRIARAQRNVVQHELKKQAQAHQRELAGLDEQLSCMDDEQFEAKYGRMPPVVLQQMRDRRSRLRTGNSA